MANKIVLYQISGDNMQKYVLNWLYFAQFICGFMVMDKFGSFILNLVIGIFMQQKFKTVLMFLILISFFHLH